MSYLAKNYNRKKISFTRGKGTYLYSSNGTKYLDFVQGIAVNSLGHAHPKLVKAIRDQSKRLWHVSNAFQIPEGERLAKKLCQKTFADYVMFQNSGAEATEAAIKVARRYFYSIGKPNKNRVLCIKNSFHGRTIAAIFASGSKKMIEGFGPKAGYGFDHFDFGDHKSLKKAITNKTAAIMVEPVMGEGGIKVIPDWCLRELRHICNKKKILLILDEVQCGIGRSGNFFAFESSKVKPDIVPIAKGIGGGFPIGALLMTKKVASAMVPGTHGSTFGGNPLAMTAGIKTLELLKQEGTYEKLESTTSRLIEGILQSADNNGIAIHGGSISAMFGFFLCEGPVRNFEEAKTNDSELFGKLHSEMLKRGIYLAPSPFEAGFTSLAHSEEEIDRTIEAFDQSFNAIKS